MGLEAEIGSLEIGKLADVIVVKLNSLHSTPRPSDLVSLIVYSAQPTDIDAVVVDGDVVMQERKLLTIDQQQIIADANHEACLLMARAGLNQVLGTLGDREMERNF
jgi:5-methylthioadenosine/S-adenosylhomocysteine deaminase